MSATGNFKQLGMRQTHSVVLAICSALSSHLVCVQLVEQPELGVPDAQSVVVTSAGKLLPTRRPFKATDLEKFVRYVRAHKYKIHITTWHGAGSCYCDLIWPYNV